MIGQTIAHYKITAKLGEGGMGVVYKAEDTKLDRPVALKFLAPHLLRDEEANKRFHREAKAAAALHHPNVCPVYEIGEVDEQTFLAMAFIEGEGLDKRIEPGPLKIPDVLDIARQIGQGLEAAHEKGIVHRDIKPGNVILDDKGHVTVMDFGLALLTEGSKLTQHDTTLGTVAYMSPEQAEGAEVDHRSDIWALGCVVYEMVCGQRAFRGLYDQALVYEIFNEEPEPLTGLRTGVPMELEWLVVKCLEKNRGNRYQNAAELIVDLRNLAEKLKSGRSAVLRGTRGVTAGVATGEPIPTGTLAGPSSTVQPAVSETAAATGAEPLPGEVGASSQLEARTGPTSVGSGRERVWIVAAVLAVAAFLTLLVVNLTTSTPAPRPITFTIDPPEGVVFQDGWLAPPVLSPDGGKLAFVGRADRGSSLWVRPLDSLEAENLAGTEGAQYPFWSPDSRYLAFFAEGKLKKIDTTGGPPQTLCEAPQGRGGTWAEDDQGRGVILFAPSNRDPLHLVSSAGGESSPVTALPESGAHVNHRQPRFLPDGRRFLYLVWASSTDAAGSPVFLADIEGASSSTPKTDESKPLLVASSRPWYAPPTASHPRVYLVYVRGATLFAHPFDADRAELTGEAFPIVENVFSGGNRHGGDFSVSADGILSYRTGGGRVSRQITWFDRRGEPSGTIGEPVDGIGLGLSPDGGRAVREAGGRVRRGETHC